MLAEPDRVSADARPARRTTFNPDRYVRITFAAAIVFLILIGALSYHSTLVAGESDESVRHTRRVSANLEDMLYSMTSIEASGAAYILTGNESYLDLWRSSTATLQARAARLHDLTRDNPLQQGRLPALDVLIAQRVQFGAQVIALRREHGLVAAAEEIRTGSGRNLTIEFRRQVQEMLNEESRLLVQRTATWRANVQTTRTVLLVGRVRAGQMP